VKQISETFRRVVESDSRTDECIVDPKHFPQHAFWERYEQIHGVHDHTKEVEHVVTGLSIAKPSAHDAGVPLPGFPDVVQYADVSASDHKTHADHLKSLAEFIKLRAAEVAPSNLHVVEVGSWKGASTIAILKAADNVLLRCVDTWKGNPSDHTGEIAAVEDVFATFMDNITNSGVSDRLTIVKKDSVTAAGQMIDKVDVVFLDADHTYQSVKADINAWYGKLMDNGWMIGHDYYVKQFPGLTKAVNEIFGERVAVYGYNEAGGFWVVENRGGVAQPQVRTGA
jgi:hypothetical protein